MASQDLEIINVVTNKREVNSEYYPIWASDMDLLLTSKGLDSYIYEEKLKKIKITDSEYKNSCIKVKGTSDLYFSPSVTEAMFKNDIKAKRYINVNLDDNNKNKIDFKSKTAFEIWKLLESTYQEGKEERKLKYKRKLDSMMYNKKDDFEMFLSNMEIIFSKLIELNVDINNENKFNYLYNALPYDIIQQTNIISYQEDWEECCEHLKKTIPRLKFLKELRTNQTKTEANYSGVRNYNKYKHKYNSNNNNYYNRNLKCFNCGEIGHKAKNCKQKQNNNYNRKYYNNKYKRFNYKDSNKRTTKGRRRHNYHEADNAEAKESDIEERYNEIYDNALTTNYNDEEKQENSNEKKNF
ncbi:hypothetical protein BCR32DRAFT_244263 [Anaeromyces robustus]|uniref:CCHC-type domain-containing protein n=1 Tax=Anaeromyces robustus TaxID=1754192 RepID=A0A1Y1WTQ8_9FUNG|nr:hypothetical protein BCR32DRAFT_248509 [Anaeromyces robustus]ORX76917.1 hypothetical protein BCR32DRAFT_248363 [Anaeromyces robustus]ORX82287.1 hypothetical protein BCR32DRAFT_244263 [Anaeromyces robustus]|eukprot:ORX76740.1 hypothetical protein BCR32DRAFT_248509 [Anaeromyces robustus]